MSKNILITGASGNLGETVVNFFAEKRFSIVATYSKEKGAGFPNVIWMPWKTNDLILTSDLSQKLEDLEPLSGWIHLIGGFYGGLNLDEVPLQKMKQMMEMNLESAYELTPIVFPLFHEEIFSSVVFIGAEAALHPSPKYGAYGTSKAALDYYFKTLAEENKGKNISVNMIIPSTIDTETNRQSMPNADYSNWVKPEEISNVIDFLFSDNAKKINGSTIRMNS